MEALIAVADAGTFTDATKRAHCALFDAGVRIKWPVKPVRLASSLPALVA
jgi:hypothetical protein